MYSTYADDFKVPLARDYEESLSYYLKRKGRRHYNMLKKESLTLQKEEHGKRVNAKEAAQNPKRNKKIENKSDQQEEEMRKKFNELLNKTEWSPISLMGRIVRPKLLLPTIIEEEETRLWKMFEETQIGYDAAGSAPPDAAPGDWNMETKDAEETQTNQRDDDAEQKRLKMERKRKERHDDAEQKRFKMLDTRYDAGVERWWWPKSYP